MDKYSIRLEGGNVGPKMLSSIQGLARLRGRLAREVPQYLETNQGIITQELVQGLHARTL